MAIDLTNNSISHTGTVKILLADDHPLVLESVSKLLEPYFSIVDMIQDSSEIMPRALEHRPDVILLDACMPGLDGFAAMRQLRKHIPRVKVILLTMLTETISISEAFRAGASGYVLKQSAAEELRLAIQTVLANKRFLSEKISSDVREALEHEWFRPEDYSSELTSRQREILVLLAAGRRSREIAEELHISMKTVEFHKANISRKLGVHTTSDLVKFALAYGITTLQIGVSPPDPASDYPG
jgi:DNA-binding NarL/FixJ family response regulator